MPTLKPLEVITARILVMRDKRVLVDADLAALYGVTTKRLNEEVKRNAIEQGYRAALQSALRPYAETGAAQARRHTVPRLPTAAHAGTSNHKTVGR